MAKNLDHFHHGYLVKFQQYCNRFSCAETGCESADIQEVYKSIDDYIVSQNSHSFKNVEGFATEWGPKTFYEPIRITSIIGTRAHVSYLRKNAYTKKEVWNLKDSNRKFILNNEANLATMSKIKKLLEKSQKLQAQANELNKSFEMVELKQLVEEAKNGNN